MMGYCGLVCQTCPIYSATREVNRDRQGRMRDEIARRCRERYGTQYTREEITDCDGCRADGGRLFTGCTACAIRACAMQKRIENCAYCSGYVCETLAAFFAAEPDAKTRLDKIRSGVR